MSKLVITTIEQNKSLIEKERLSCAQNKPFTRHNNIICFLSERKHIINTISTDIDKENIINKLLELNLCTPEYLDFLKFSYTSYLSAGEPIYFKSSDNGLVSYIYYKDKCTNIKDKLPYYIQSGIYGNDTFTPIFSHTFDSAILSAYNSLKATELIEEYNIVYALNPFPGHHATTNSYSGYCFFNNGAICAQQLLSTKKYNKICILDLDFHHGDGTQKIYYNRSDVLTVSLHGCPSNEYPYFTGYNNEVGSGYNINYPIKGGIKIDKYLDILKEALNKIDNYNPDVIVIAFGADTYKEDEEVHELSRFNINLKDYIDIGKTIAKLNKKIIVTQEGGYMLEHIGKIVDNFLTGLISFIN